MATSRRRSVVLLLAFQAIYLIWLLVFGRFLSGDEIAYKAAGREWARGGAFIAPELQGYGSWRDPAHPYQLRRGFAPPLYTFAFGLFVKVTGFNPTTSALFDALIHIVLGWATWTLARALGPRLPYGAAALAAAATLPLGTAGRPDEMGALLAMFGAALLLREVTLRRAAVAGMLFGLAAGTSLVAGAVLLVWPLLAFLQRRPRGLRAGLRTGLLPPAGFILCAGLVFVLVLLPLYLITPYGLAQLTQAAGGSVHTTLRYAVENSFRYGRSHYLAAAAALMIALAHAVSALRQRAWMSWIELWLPPLAALAALLIVLPVKYYYVWIVVPSMFAAAACAFALLPWRFASRAALLGVATLLWCAAGSRFFFMSLVRATLPSGQHMTENVQLLHRMIPDGSGVMTYDFWPALADSSYRTYSVEADPPWKDVDYIVLTGNGSGAPGQPQMLRPEQQSYVQSHYAAIYDNLNRRPFGIGALHTNSAWGYGPLILKRKDAGR